MHTLRGSCHCGQLQLAFDSARAPEELPVRTCQCTFCQRHAGRYTSDHDGRVVFTEADPQLTSRYRFGLESADFLICARCGVFVGAVGEAHAGSGTWLAVINTLALDDRHRFVQPARAMDFDAESLEERLARRRLSWTPATVVRG
jgi:hypothetical protein